MVREVREETHLKEYQWKLWEGLCILLLENE